MQCNTSILESHLDIFDYVNLNGLNMTESYQGLRKTT